MTRETLENLIIGATGRDDKITLIRSAINLAIEKVSVQALWSDLRTEADVTITTGSRFVQLVAGTMRVVEARRIDGTSSEPLTIRTATRMVRDYPNPEAMSRGVPRFGYLLGTKLYLVPIPIQNYTIRYSYFPLHEPLSQASSAIRIRAAGEAITAYAISWVFRSLEKHDDANQWLAMYNNCLALAIKADREDSVIQREMESRGSVAPSLNPPWLDPFVYSVF